MKTSADDDVGVSKRVEIVLDRGGNLRWMYRRRLSVASSIESSNQRRYQLRFYRKTKCVCVCVCVEGRSKIDAILMTHTRRVVGSDFFRFVSFRFFSTEFFL